MGRRCKLTPELQEEICVLIAKGCHVEIACRAVGISTSSYYSWRQQGEAEETARQEAAEQEPEWITTREAAELTDLPATTLRKHARAGDFQAKKQGGRWLLDRAGLLLWAAPERNPYLQFCEAVRQAEAEAERHLVEVWQEQISKDWRAARDFLSRRYPERWGPHHQIAAKLQADAQARIEIESKVTHEVVCTEEEKTVMVEWMRTYLMQQAREHGEIEMAILDLLEDGEGHSFEEVVEAIEKEWAGKALRCLQDLVKTSQVRSEGVGINERWIRAWLPEAVDDEAGVPPAAEPSPVEPSPDDDLLRPIVKPPARKIVLAGKTHFTKLRDGEL